MYEDTSDIPLQEMRTQVAPARKTRPKGQGAAQVRQLYQPLLEDVAAGKEEWRDVPGFEGVLIVSNLGRVARMQGFQMAKGYLGVSLVHGVGSHPAITGLHGEREGHTIPIHRLVALTFIGEPADPRLDVNHEDGNKHNNRVSNLAWCTRAENLAHARRTGLQTDPLRSYTREQYLEARRLASEGMKLLDIAKRLGMSVGGVHYAVKISKKWRDS